MKNEPNSAIISLTDVSKVFRLGLMKKKTAVDHLSLDIPKGEVVGLLGPNGSGKSTTIKMILGFLTPTSGSITIGKLQPRDTNSRKSLGYLPENPRFQKFLSGRDILKYYGTLMGIPRDILKKRMDSLLERVNLSAAADERVRGYSKGMTQRLAIAQALLNQPEIIILDEPMSGLDPIGRMEIRSLIRNIHQDYPETTIFFSTHILSDVEQLCTHVALLKKGRLSTYCPISDLLAQNEEHYQVVVSHLSEAMAAEFKDQKLKTPLGWQLNINGTDELIKDVTKLQKSGAKIVGISTPRQSLEVALFTDSQPEPQTSEANL